MCNFQRKFKCLWINGTSLSGFKCIWTFCKWFFFSFYLETMHLFVEFEITYFCFVVLHGLLTFMLNWDSSWIPWKIVGLRSVVGFRTCFFNSIKFTISDYLMWWKIYSLAGHIALTFPSKLHFDKEKLTGSLRASKDSHCINRFQINLTNLTYINVLVYLYVFRLILRYFFFKFWFWKTCHL